MPLGEPRALDGGWGWVVVLGSFICYFIADGWSYSFGIIFPTLIEHFGDGKGKTAVIAALLYGIPMVISPLVCALTTVYGCRPVAVAGGVVTGVSFIISAYATSVYYLCISTGILGSLGLCMTYVPAIVAVTVYFDKRRGLATGLAVTGSGLGAFAFPPLLEWLIGLYYWRGALLVLGAIGFNIVAAGSVFRPLPHEKEPEDLNDTSSNSNTHVKRTSGNILIPRLHDETLIRNRTQSLNAMQKSNTEDSFLWTKPDKPLTFEETTLTEDHHLLEAPDSPKSPNTNSSPDLYSPNNYQSTNQSNEAMSQNRDKKYNLITETKTILANMMDKSLLCCWNFLLFLGAHFILYLWIGIPYVYLVDKSALLGINKTKAAFLLSVIGISRTVGQLILGVLADFRQINSLLLFALTIITSGLVTLLVPFYTNYISLCVYSVIFGFAVSSTYSLEMICIIELVGMDRSTNGFGLLQLVIGIATLLGTPISGWLFDVTGQYNPSFYIAGSLIIFAGLMLLVLPWTTRHPLKPSDPLNV